jgi:hypothetical protein
MATKTKAAGQKMQAATNRTGALVSKNLGKISTAMFSISTAATAIFSIAVFVRSLKELAAEAARGHEDFERLSGALKVFREVLIEIIQDTELFEATMSSAADTIIFAAATMKTAAEDVGQSFLVLLQATGAGVGPAAPFASVLSKLFGSKEEQDAVIDFATRLNQHLAEMQARVAVLGGEKITFLPEGLIPGDVFGQITAEGERFAEMMNETARITEENIGDIGEATLLTTKQFQAFAQAAALAGSILGQAFSQGGIGARQAIAQILSFVAVLAQSRAITYAAAAIAASSGPLGRALEGDPKKLKAAAALWQKVAIGAAAGAAFLAASEGGGATGSRGVTQFGEEAFPDSSGRAQTIHLHLEGSTILGTSPQKIARELEKLQREARSDNA